VPAGLLCAHQEGAYLSAGLGRTAQHTVGPVATAPLADWQARYGVTPAAGSGYAAPYPLAAAAAVHPPAVAAAAAATALSAAVQGSGAASCPNVAA
jgi:hypothetical protein